MTHPEDHACEGRGRSSSITMEDRVRGALLGLATGDALGAPVEFLAPEEIARRHGRWTEMRAGGPWLLGEWTDDTALTLAAASAYAGGEFDLERAARAMVAWKGTDPKDIGNLTRIALGMIEAGSATATTAGERALRAYPGSAGNGSLMRAAPTGLVRASEDPKLVAESAALSRITHADPRCVSACIAFNAALSALIGKEGRIGEALAAAETITASGTAHGEVAELVRGVREYRSPRHAEDAIGYVLLSLERALIALRDAKSFEDGVVEVVNRGGDTDTNGAIAGTLLGACFGPSAIPERWIRSLMNRRPIEDTIEGLLRFRGGR